MGEGGGRGSGDCVLEMEVSVLAALLVCDKDLRECGIVLELCGTTDCCAKAPSCCGITVTCVVDFRVC